MYRYVTSFFVFVLFFMSRAQSPVSFSIYTISPTGSITCSQSSVHFIAGSADTNVNYTWHSLQTSYYGQEVSIGIPGTYTVMASSPSLVSSYKIISVSINTLAPVAYISAVSQVIYCGTGITGSFNTSGNLTASTSSHRFISPYGGTVTVNSLTASYKPLAPGVYTYALVNTETGCESTRKTFTAAVGNGGFPSFNLVSPTNFTLGCATRSVMTVSFTNGNTNPLGGSVSYTLLSPSSTAPPATGALSSTTVYSIVAPGTYTAITRDNSTFCQTGSAFTVMQPLAAPLTLMVPTQTLDCRHPRETLIARSSAPNVSYGWQWQVGQSSTDDTLMIINNPSSISIQTVLVQNYTLTLTNDDNLCKNVSVLSVYQDFFPPNALINSSAHSLSCLSPTLNLVNMSTSGIPPSSGFSTSLPVEVLSWLGPPPQGSAQHITNYTVYTPGIYTLEVLDDNNGCKAKDTIAIFDGRVYPLVDPEGTPVFCINSAVASVSIYPTVNDTLGIYTYLWESPPATSLSAVTGATVNANAVGIYSVLVTNAQSGCSTVGQIIVNNCITGIAQYASEPELLQVYPNPGSGKFTVTVGRNEQERKVQIYNSSGKLLREGNVNASAFLIDLGQQENGLYLLVVLEENGVVYSRKLVKN